MSWPILRVIALLLSLSACVSSQQRPYGETRDLPPDLDGGVEVDLNETYFLELPDCVTVLPAHQAGGERFASEAVLEAALVRYARDRFPTVIGGPERLRLVDRMLVDLSVPEDRAYYARRTRCRYFLEFAPWRDENLYAVVYNRKAVGIDARLVDARGEEPLWRARHVTARSDGSLPLSPLGAIVGAFEAARMESEADLPQSMADDVARRLIATLPDLGLTEGVTELTGAFGTQ